MAVIVKWGAEATYDVPKRYSHEQRPTNDVAE
jgi:hypothetical protein